LFHFSHCREPLRDNIEEFKSFFLETVTNRQLSADAGASRSVTDYTIDTGLNDESVVLGRDAQTGFHEIAAVKQEFQDYRGDKGRKS